MGGQKPHGGSQGGPRGVPGGPRGVPGGQTISHHSDCPFCGVKVKNPSQNIKKTEAPAPRQHNLMYRAINASRHQSSRRGAFTLVFLMFLLGKKSPFCGVKVKNPNRNIKKTKAPAPRQHFILISAKDASLPTMPTRLQQQKAAPATSSFGRGQMVF